ncbi:MAG TPA: metal-dependent hydrolase [bacterium]|nr:metal-dependent hydrolase [bacterium]
MDNLSHTLVGAAIANCGPRQKLGKSATWTLLVTANLPDIDAILRFWGPDYYILYHRSFTHSVVGLFTIPLLVAAFIRIFWPEKRFWTFYWISFLGILSHQIFDLITSWETLVFHPLSQQRFSLGWVFIVDFFFWGILGLPLLVRIFWKTDLKKWSRVSLAALALYIGFCGVNWEKARIMGRELAAEIGPQATLLGVYPEPLSPLNWGAIVKVDGQFHQVFFHTYDSLATLRQRPNRTFDRNLDNPDVQAALATPPGKAYLKWAQAPAALVEKDGEGPVVILYDVRFVRPDRGPQRWFHLTIEMDKKRHYLRHSWGS